MSIKISDLVYNYPHSTYAVLNGINLEINKGDVLVLLGNNGCGKTTLIKNIVGLTKPKTGTIEIDGVNLLSLSIHKRSKYISYVSQKVNMLEDIKIIDYLTYGFANSIKFYEKPNKEQINKAMEYADKLHITHLLNKKIDEISGGERQIVSICCALLQDSEVLILDEPTSALDLNNQNMVLSTLKEIALKENKTMILSIHNPNHALYLNSMVAVMKEGHIIEYGNSLDIIKVEKLKTIYGNNLCYSNELGYKEVSFKNN